MRKKNVYEDKRLLDALDHIDEKYIAETEKYYRDLPLREVRGRTRITARSIRLTVAFVACLLLLSAAMPLVGLLINKIPEITGPAGSSGVTSTPDTFENVEDDLPEEYFTTGNIVSAGAMALGIEYEGCWIYVTGTFGSNVSHIIKYDPATKTNLHICLDQSCNHSYATCPLCSPLGMDVNYMDVSGDWLVYDFSTSSSNGNGPIGKKLCAYNMKTDDARVIHEKTEIGDRVEYVSGYHVMGDFVYMSINVIDNSDPQEKKMRTDIFSYDLATGERVFMFEEPEDMSLIGITNKRLFFTGKRSRLLDPAVIWTTDYNGENLKKEEVLDFDPIMVCGTYAYSVNSVTESGYRSMKVYDLATDSIFTIDFGEPIQYVFLDSGELGFTTTSRIGEFNEYQKDPDAYIAKNYPNVTSSDDISSVKSEIARLKSEIELRLNCKVKMQFYLTDVRGENKTLVFEGENIDFNPYRRVGDYIIGYLRKASKYEMRILDSGFAALNLKTGEITLIPLMKFED